MQLISAFCRSYLMEGRSAPVYSKTQVHELVTQILNLIFRARTVSAAELQDSNHVRGKTGENSEM